MTKPAVSYIWELVIGSMIDLRSQDAKLKSVEDFNCELVKTSPLFHIPFILSSEGDKRWRNLQAKERRALQKQSV